MNLKNCPLAGLEKVSAMEHKILSGEELMAQDLPERICYWGEFFKEKDQMAIIAREKRCKSFLALQIGVSISNGLDCLGYKTGQGNVLYINF